MAKNEWNIKILESENPNLRGFFVEVLNNGESVGALKGVMPSFDRAIEEAKGIVLNQITILQSKIQHAKVAQDFFTHKFLMNKMLNGIYGVGIMYDEKGLPYLEVAMDTKNEYLMQLVPDKITAPHTIFEYPIKKVYGEQAVAQKIK